MMSEILFSIVKIVCYVLVAYGACNIIVFADGPFKIFSKLREVTSNISEHFGKLFTCMMCLSANFGWICSLFNWFLIPIAFTPFNIIFKGYEDLWWLALLCDGAFTTAIVYLIYVVNEYFEMKINYYEHNTLRNEDEIEGYDSYDQNGEMLIVEDITQKR